MKSLLIVALLVCFSSLPSFGCQCGPSGHASAYVKEASLAFVGRVTFTDDDGSGKFTQHTLVHFEVEEAFKGLKPDVRDVWIDPGSCTSCYWEYKLGERYLVFAYGGSLLPKDTNAVSAASNWCKVKPYPATFDIRNPPKVYRAPECSGTRQITNETANSVAKEVYWLRNYKKKAEKITN